MKKLSLLFLSILMIVSCDSGRKMGGGCVGDDCQATYKVDAPVFSILDGSNVLAGTELAITTATDDAEIKYTTNGDDPAESGQVYTNSIIINSDITVRAIASKKDMEDSEETTAAYTVSIPNQVVAPVFVPAPSAGAILKGAAIGMYTTTPGAVIRYNVGSTAPTVSSGTLYDQDHQPTLTSSSTIKAIAYMPDNSQPASSVVTGSYTFQTVVKPTITASGDYPNSGSTICTNNTLSISSATNGATIRYRLTTDGTVPTAPTSINSGTGYTGPINLAQYSNKTVKIRATAFKGDMNPSAVAYASYDVMTPGDLPKPTIKCTGALNASSKTITITLPQQSCTSATILDFTSIIYYQYPYENGSTVTPPLNPVNTSYWSNYSQSFTINSSKDIVAALKKTGIGSYFGYPSVNSCCVGSGCIKKVDGDLDADIIK